VLVRYRNARVGGEVGIEGAMVEALGDWAVVGWAWSRAVEGKTVSRRLTPAQAALYEEWIANRHRLKQIVAEMEKVSAAAGEILLRQADKDRSRTVR
jgi:hypothetical protein